MQKQNRRSFLQFLGRSTLVAGTASIFAPLSACSENTTEATEAKSSTAKAFPFKGLKAQRIDELQLDEALQYEILVQWNDKLSEDARFGFNNDYIAFIPLNHSDNDGLLWVNHEYIHPMFVSGFNRHDENATRTQAQVDEEMEQVGGSILRIQKDENGRWQLIPNDPLNRRITGKTMIPFDWHEPIAGQTEAMGTLANCSGGVTPWGSILTCEENYDLFYGENIYTPNQAQPEFQKSFYGWEAFYKNPPEHYGWVVEVNPQTGVSKKLIALGRCAHECATVAELPDKRVVVYTGDDKNDECLYKFVSSKPQSLREGTLYVANTEKGQWIPLDLERSPILKTRFNTQTEVLIHLREAAKLVGGTPLARPEDIEIDPITKDVFVSLTNNTPKENYYGEILKIVEHQGDKTSETFQAVTFLAGGEETGFACPDNLAFDKKGNLWFTTDMSGSKMGKAPYEAFGNNSLFLVPAEGSRAGEAIRVATAPFDAELTGPFFAPDGRTLFLSVQHPGEQSRSLDQLTSHWPEGGTALPKPAVVAIQGEGLDYFV